MLEMEAEVMAKKRAWSPFVRTYSRPAQEVEDDLVKYVGDYVKLDQAAIARKELPLLRPDLPPGKSGPIGAMAALNKLVKCLREGCGQDPFDVNQMYIPLGRGPKTGLMRWSKKGGTGKNENFHGGINRLVNGVARLGAEACDARLLQRIHRHNHDMDRKLGRTSKQSTLWVWRERKANAAAESILTSRPFPRAGDTPTVAAEDFEPMGFEYAEQRRANALTNAKTAAANSLVLTRTSLPSTTAGDTSRAGAAAVGAGAGAPAGTAVGACARVMPLPLTNRGGRPGAAALMPSTIATGSSAGAGAVPPLLLPPTATGGAAEGAGAVPPLLLPSTTTGVAAEGAAGASGGGVMGGATSRTYRSNAGEAAAQDISRGNYGGGRRLPSRHPTLERVKALTPTSDAELEAFATCLAEATMVCDGKSQVMTEATKRYNARYYRQALTGGAPKLIRAPTTVEKARNRSKIAAKAGRDRDAAADLAAVNEISRVRTSSASTSTSTPPPASKRARGDRDRASERVASGVPLKLEQISTLTDAAAIAYMKAIGLKLTGNVALKRKKLSDFFESKNISEYRYSPSRPATSPAPAEGPASGHMSIRGLGTRNICWC
ncbi:unnamed protein product [Ectocarpus sp. CCAP 1310/34]|nr:unnamed protein product [Ectocarpus sp. CCAP 1310/34]